MAALLSEPRLSLPIFSLLLAALRLFPFVFPHPLLCLFSPCPPRLQVSLTCLSPSRAGARSGPSLLLPTLITTLGTGDDDFVFLTFITPLAYTTL